jgi:hypothetical protein
MKKLTGLELLMGLLSVVLDTLFHAPGASGSTLFGRARSDLATFEQTNHPVAPGTYRNKCAAIVVPSVSPALWLQGHRCLCAADRRVAVVTMEPLSH